MSQIGNPSSGGGGGGPTGPAGGFLSGTYPDPGYNPDWTQHKQLTADTTYFVTVFAGTVVGGSLYTNGRYEDVALTGGSGSGAVASIIVEGGAVTVVIASNEGSGYVVGNVLSANAANIGGTGSGFTFTITAIGDDANDGLLSTTPWRTLAHANEVICTTLDFMSFNVTVACRGAFEGADTGNSFTSLANSVDNYDNACRFIHTSATSEPRDARIGYKPNAGGCINYVCDSSVAIYVQNITIDVRNVPDFAPIFNGGGGQLYLGDGSGGTVYFLNDPGHDAGDAITVTTGSFVQLSDNIVFDGGDYDMILRADGRSLLSIGWWSDVTFTFINGPRWRVFAQAGFVLGGNNDASLDCFGAIQSGGSNACTFTGSPGTPDVNMPNGKFLVAGPNSYIDVSRFSGDLSFFPGAAPGIIYFGGSYVYWDGAKTVTLTSETNLQNRALFDHFASVGNGTTVETDLYSDTIAARQLVNNGDKLEAYYGGSFVSSGTATREIKIYFGGTVIFDTGTLTLSLSSQWTAYVDLIRVSASVVRYMVSFTTEGAALAAYTAAGEVTGLTLANTNILKITGQAAGVGAATNDIVAKLGSVKFLAAA